MCESHARQFVHSYIRLLDATEYTFTYVTHVFESNMADTPMILFYLHFSALTFFLFETFDFNNECVNKY